MMRWGIGTVVSIRERRANSEDVIVKMEDGRECTAFHDVEVQGPLYPGDEVLLNITGVDLGLGTGGVHFVAAVLRHSSGSATDMRHRSDNPRTGHMMKMRYTPFQRAVLAAEEPDSLWHERFAAGHKLQGMPVLIGQLHSMLPAAMCWLYEQGAIPHVKIVYIMSDGGALPLSFSRHVHTLNTLGWLAGTITYGHAYGGEVETINKFSALQAAKHVLHADLAIVTMGPGIAGTSTAYGHSAMETGELINAVVALEGRPVVMPRLSFHDRRKRHYGLSHHTFSALTIAAVRSAVLPIPHRLAFAQRSYMIDQLSAHRLPAQHDVRWIDGVTVELVEQSLRHYPYPVMTMGRSVRDDPAFFLAVAAAAQFVWDEYLAST